jgi:hypothetical protein
VSQSASIHMRTTRPSPAAIPRVAPPVTGYTMRSLAFDPADILSEKALAMKHFVIVAGALVAISLFSGKAQAQNLGTNMSRGTSHSIGSPTVSPYLNLLTSDAFGNVGIGGGYQTLVKPLVDSRKAINANSAAISRLASGGGGGAGPGAAHFRNYSHYYPSASGR